MVTKSRRALWLRWRETGQSIPLIHWVIRLGLLPFDLGPISQVLHHPECTRFTSSSSRPGWMVEEETSHPGIWGMPGMRSGPNKPLVGLQAEQFNTWFKQNGEYFKMRLYFLCEVGLLKTRRIKDCRKKRQQNLQKHFRSFQTVMTSFYELMQT